MEAKEYKFVVEGFKGSTKETEKKEKTLKINVQNYKNYIFNIQTGIRTLFML